MEWTCGSTEETSESVWIEEGGGGARRDADADSLESAEGEVS